MRRGCQLQLFGEPMAPIRDNLDDAQADAVRLKIARLDADGVLYLDAGAEFIWKQVTAAATIAA
jgi:hypothetical protein